MSFREEDKEKDSSRGLGLGLAAAAAIGVGVGAALYYFINKRTETPTAEGSTTRGWTCESPHTFIEPEDSLCNSDNSYTTLSEHSTTDTSMFEDSLSCKGSHFDSQNDTTEEEYCYWDSETSESSTEDSRSTDETDSESDESNYVTTDTDSDESHDSDLSDWDVTTSLDYPSFEPPLTRNYLENYARNLFMSRNVDKR
ncbi:unnamed protein product [Euphydryas editha]|uniref:Uncharacterized protein n=1 Tax=Euphydryas editha TaxID=104508 RepID=A0AAU9UNT5_EUPED|nr:unnamed protein product [Euphydryas editha]